MTLLESLLTPTAVRALWGRPDFPGRWRIQRWAEQHRGAIAQRPPRRVSMDDFSFLVSPQASLDVYLNGITRNSSIERILRTHVEPGTTVLDVGANIGWTARLMSHLVGSDGRVHAFEPLPVAHENLMLNAQDAPLHNIATYATAATDAAGQIELFVESDDAAALGTMRHPMAGGGTRAHRVPTLTLDSLIDELGPVRFVKIDVEGAEHKVLLGMRQMLERWRPTLALELTDAWLRQLGSSAQALLDDLIAQGYTALDGAAPHSGPLTTAPTGQVDLICLPKR